MGSKKDMRRVDLAIPFSEPEASDRPDASSSFAQILPMAGLFLRNKLISWFAVVFSVQTWLAETPETRKKAGTASGGWFNAAMALMSLMVSYMPLFLPPAGTQQATGTGAQPPVPPSH